MQSNSSRARIRPGSRCTEGWRELGARASGALTRFWPIPVETAGPSAANTSAAPPASMPRLAHWAFMAADVFDDADKVIVRIEAPGLRSEDFNVELKGDVLTVRGEKRIDREATEGRWRVVQCAYGSFRRGMALSVPVKADQTKASYRDGVLRIEPAKSDEARAQAHRGADRLNAGASKAGRRQFTVQTARHRPGCSLARA